MPSRTIATRFAGALDRRDVAEAGRYLAADCCYQIGEEVLIGPEAIIASYRESDEWGRGVLEQVVYKSRVEQSRDHVTVTYIDRLFHHGETHEYRCRQHLWLDTSGRIARIVHEELPGEQERLDEEIARWGGEEMSCQPRTRALTTKLTKEHKGQKSSACSYTDIILGKKSVRPGLLTFDFRLLVSS